MAWRSPRTAAFSLVTVEGIGGEPGVVEVYDNGAFRRVGQIDIGKQAGGIALLGTELSPPEADSPVPGQAAADLRRDFLRGLAAVDRRLRLRRALAALVWLAPASCLWLLSTWLLRVAAGGDGSVAALWPSWAGGIVLLALLLREAASLGRNLPAAARAVDRAGDLHDTVATALEMQRRLDTRPDDRRHARNDAEAVWPLPWIALVLERGVAGLDRTGPRQTAPRLVPRGAAVSAILSAVLLAPIALPTSFVGEALAAAMNGDSAESAARGLEAAALLEEESGRRPGVPEFDVRLSDLPFLTLRVREPDSSDDARRAAGDGSEGAEGSLGDDADAEGSRGQRRRRRGRGGRPHRRTELRDRRRPHARAGHQRRRRRGRVERTRDAGRR